MSSLVEHPHIEVRQRKMSVRLSEWLDQYNLVSQKQQEYLAKINDLRRSLQNRDEQTMLTHIERMRRLEKARQKKATYPKMAMSKMINDPISNGPEPFPLRTPQNGAKFQMSPNASPRRLNPITKRKKAEENMDQLKPEVRVPPIVMDKMRTEYEPFESIARRNNLQLDRLFNSTAVPLGVRPKRKTPTMMARMPLTVSTVTVKEVSENQITSPHNLEYITDVSQRKTIQGGQDQQLDSVQE